MSFSTSCSSRSNNMGQDRYKAYLNVCKFQYIDYNDKNNKEFTQTSLSRSNFKSLMQEKNIKLPSFDDFKAGKTIHYGPTGFFTSERSVDLNSTMLFARTTDPLEQLQVKKEAVERFQKVKNNCEINKTISCDSSIDVTLLQAYENEISFDLPGFVLPNLTSSQQANLDCTLRPQDKSHLDQPEQSNDVSVLCVKDVSFEDLGLNKTVNAEDLNWHITKVSDWRVQDGKNQFKVHYKKINRRSYRP